MNKPKFKYVSDCGVLVELATSVDDEVNQAIIQFDRVIAEANIAGVREVVPALVNLMIIFDPLVTDHKTIQTAVEALWPLEEGQKQQNNHHIINVCYDKEFSPDLEPVAVVCGTSVEAVIDAHLSGQYRVGMYGFAPGFAYMTGVPDAIQVPRKKSPVRDVPTGAVIIAGPQCLTTTLKMPTGWSIIGRSDATIMTDNAERAFLFDVGDTVAFNRIRADELKWVAT